jgi:hypothetical protein
MESAMISLSYILAAVFTVTVLLTMGAWIANRRISRLESRIDELEHGIVRLMEPTR